MDALTRTLGLACTAGAWIWIYAVTADDLRQSEAAGPGIEAGWLLWLMLATAVAESIAATTLFIVRPVPKVWLYALGLVAAALAFRRGTERLEREVVGWAAGVPSLPPLGTIASSAAAVLGLALLVRDAARRHRRVTH